ncbi:cramped protein [Holotrichia oblita]|uniref:Cramped protein n=1 Tax=Holotrichia oblita TaxID=644536 RepID=A0ACB9T8Z0_HOLOL|nr:cramped protein [Holotrichia oblita]
MNNDLPNNCKIILQQNIPIEDLLGSVTTYNNVEGSDSKSLQLRTSARVFKKMKLDSANAAVATSTIQEKKDPQSTKDETKPELQTARKVCRPLWTQEDKNLFFEALNEFGKDFEAIHSYVSNKLKKKGVAETMIKTKEQMRHLYYRTWHKISKHLRFSDEKENDLKLPARVTVQLVPKDMSTWMYVQNISQNPRVRTVLPLQKRLSSLLMCMSDRWKTHRVAESEKMLQSFKECANGDTQVIQEMEEENKIIADPILRFAPPNTCNIELPTLNLSEYLTSQSVCLNAYEERFGVKSPGEQLWLKSYPNCRVGYSKRGGTKRPRQESNSEKTSPTNKVVTTDNNENCVSEELPASVSEVIDEAVNTLLALQQYQQQCHESAGSSDEKPEPTEIKPDVKDLEKKQHDIAKIRNGWTLVDCGTLSIGDLYLMFGSDSKLILEYNWDQDVIKKEEEPSGNKNQENIEPIDEFDCSTKADIKDSLIKHPNDLSVTLKRLLSVAKLHYRKNRIQCPCGHVCSDTSKHSSNKNKIVTKNLTVTTSKDKFYNNQEKPVSVQQHGEVLMFQSLNNDTHIRRLSPSILFRRPSSPNDILREQLDSIQRLKPRYCNRRGRRPRSKPVIVERKLPILANKVENGRQIVQMNIISQDNLTSTQRPIVPKIQFENLNQESNLPNKLNPQYGSASASSSASTIVTNITFNNEVIQTTTKTDQLTRTYVAVTSTEENGVEHSVYTTQANALDISDNATTLSRVGSPTSISNLLQMALESHGAGNVMQTSEVKEDGSINFVGLLSQNMSTGNTPPTSPSRILKENENQWLNSEVADFSLSSFLGHLDSPMKTAQGNTAIAGDDNTRLSLAQDNSDFEFEKRHSLLLCGKHPLTRLIMEKEHLNTLHGGPQLMLSSS